MRRRSAFNLKFPDGPDGRIELFGMPESTAAAVVGLLRDLGIEGTEEETTTESLGENLTPPSPAELGAMLEVVGRVATKDRRLPKGTELITAYIETLEITIDPCDQDAAERLGTAAGRFAARALAELEGSEV